MEIKFKMWDKILKYYWDKLPNGYELTLDGKILVDGNLSNDMELIQFSGVNDIANSPVYVGDILQSNDGEICEVKFGEFEASPDDYHIVPCLGVYLDFKTHISEITQAIIEYKEYRNIGCIRKTPEYIVKKK